MKVEKSSADLESEIIFRGLCAHCGTCGAFCPHIQYVEEGPDAGLPKVLDSCIENVGVCYNSCPRADFNVSLLEERMFGKLRENEVLGVILETMAVKSKNGVLKSLISTALKNKMIDAMVVPKKTNDKPPNSIGVVVTDPKDIPNLSNKNTEYTGPLLTGINTACDNGLSSIGIIGNPCHHQGIAKSSLSDFDTRAKTVDLQIAVMCAAGGAKGCVYCVDYSGEFADISYSETGQEKDTAVLLIRTEKGKKLVEAALKEKIITKESESPNLDKIIELASKKKKRNITNLLKKDLGKVGYLGLTAKELSYYFNE